MTKSKTQHPILNSQPTKAEEMKVKKGLRDAFTVEELAAVKASSRSNVAMWLGASLVMKDIKAALPGEWQINFFCTVKSACRTLNTPGALLNAILDTELMRNITLTMYANGSDHEKRMEDLMKYIDEEVAENPELKKHLDELTEQYRKQMEEARIKREEAEKAVEKVLAEEKAAEQTQVTEEAKA